MDANLAKILSEIPDVTRLFLVIIAMVVVPAVANLVNSFLNKKAVNQTAKDFTTALLDVKLLLTSVDNRIKDIADNNNEECTLKQIEIAFNGCVSASVIELVKRTERIITINHIDNRANTERNVVRFVKDIMNSNKAKLSAFKRNSIPVSEFVRDEWVDDISSIILDYVYGDCNSNYSILNLKLFEAFEGISYTFNKDVSLLCIK